jgi:hypothetical protein
MLRRSLGWPLTGRTGCICLTWADSLVLTELSRTERPPLLKIDRESAPVQELSGAIDFLGVECCRTGP